MNTGMAPAAAYTDFGALAELRRQAAGGGEQALREAARQFEAVFAGMLLGSMRQAGLVEDSLFGGAQMDLARDLHDRQMAQELGRSGALGIADMIVRQLGAAAVPGPATAGLGIGDYARRGFAPLARALPTAAAEGRRVSPDTGPGRGSAAGGPGASWLPGDPVSFVRAVWGPLRRAAQELGIAPEPLLAQAALETGWGRTLPRGPDGSSSNNLFGIKADARWQGASVEHRTLEFEQGALRPRSARFRAYPDLETGALDYVSFLRSHPRYRSALERTGDPLAFVQALQEAGYATDPDYAAKIRRILDGGALRQALAALDPAPGRG